MKVRKNAVRALIGMALSAGLIGSTAGVAQASPSVPFLTITVCAEGNYTAYAKLVDSAGSVTTGKVSPGSCAGTKVGNFGTADSVYFFGIYNVSGKGFNIRQHAPDDPVYSTGSFIDGSYVSLFAKGSTTDPHYDLNAWDGAGFSEYGE